MAQRLATLAAGLGVDAEALCRRHGLSGEVLRDRTARVPLEPVLAGIEDLLDQTGHPSLGLEFATSAPVEVYHTPGLVLLASDRLREGFGRAFELQRLWGDGDRFASASPAELGLASGFVVTFRIPARRRRGHGILEACALAETMIAARALTGRHEESAVALGLPSSSDDGERLAEFFGVRPAMGTRCAYLVLDEQLVERPLLHANRMFRQIFEHQAREELGDLPAEDDLRTSVRAEVLRGFARGRSSLDDCAGALGMSARTLERRLSECGCSFQQLVDEARKHRARQLLGLNLPVDEVAILLGYAERSSFHRACLRWFGQTPAELRMASEN